MGTLCVCLYWKVYCTDHGCNGQITITWSFMDTILPPPPHLLKEVTNYAATHCLHSLTKKAQFTAPVWATHTALTKSMYSTIRPQDIARKAYNETLQYCYHSLKGIIIGGQIIGHIVTTKTCNIQPDNRPHSPEKA